ncbi:high choriolytic enzyme 1-like [Cebidichthys violaceus]|uniref:high choriolytic enzyme 1-like n=1 Tax=Cebidichthys violaceus TaxID=271503 RepID=UPI0035CC11EF
MSDHAALIITLSASRERAIIERGLQSFHSVSCIRFVPRTSERDYIHIQSLDGCYSYVGRRFNEQALSLMQQGCLYHNVVQHELLHALGFKHEQCRSNRDQHIRILWENIIPGEFYTVYGLNLTHTNVHLFIIASYPASTVIVYNVFKSRSAFSKNNQPTIEPIPDPNVEFGVATEMSQNDITRFNRLYNCS